MFRVLYKIAPPAILRNTLKSEKDRILILALLLSCGLVLFRIMYTGTPFFFFLVWNLFLAWTPYLVSGWMERQPERFQKGWVFAAGFTAWLLLLPNSFYLVTDLVHLRVREGVPYWYDQALVLSFVWNGLLLGILSVRAMEKMAAARWGLRHEWLFLYPVMWLNALGIYIGRYLRFNSWDVVANPSGLAQDVGYLMLHPLRHRFEWSMVFLYAVLMTIIYLTVKKLFSKSS